MLVGVIRAKKFTFYRLLLERSELPFTIVDQLACLVFTEVPVKYSYEAGQFAEKQRNNLLLSETSFCFETVYSHPSKIDFAARAKALGYAVIMVVIHLNHAELNAARVAQRVSEGGHSVPTPKVISRIPRMLAQVKASIPLCDQVRILDNSSAEDPFRPVVTIRNGGVQQHQSPLPGWAAELLDW